MQNEIEQVEVSLEEAKRVAAKGAAAKKLFSNREFKKVIEQGYLVDEASRLVMASADPNFSTDQKANIHAAIQGVSHFYQYIQHTITLGDMAEREIAEHEETLTEMRGEAWEDGNE